MESQFYKILFCLLSIFLVQTQQHTTKNKNANEPSPLMDLATEFMKQNGGANIGSMGGVLSSLMQSEGGKQLSGMLMDGSLNTLFEGENGINPEMIGNVMGMFNDEDNEISPEEFRRTALRDNPNEPTVGSVLGELVSNILAGKYAEKVMGYLPLVWQAVMSYTDEDARHHANEHAGHSWLLPPMIEKLHIFWDHFTESDLAKTLNKNLGLDKVLAKLVDADGNFDFDKLVSMVENHSFRRFWIAKVTNLLADLVSSIADPENQKKYLLQTQFLVNSFLKAQGYPNQALFDIHRPSETISTFLNIFIKKYFQLKIDSSTYVTPIVNYVQSLVTMAQTHGSYLKNGLASKELSNKITDTLNLQLIEPGLRVFRAYRFAKKTPQCDKYVMCLINQPDPKQKLYLQNIKLLLSKGGSIVASWFLSYRTGTSFVELYSAVMDGGNCQHKYPVDCSNFHAEEIEVTTEYYHNEL